jgi:hypothetical protein
LNLEERAWTSPDSMNDPREKSPPTIQKARNSGNTSTPNVAKRKRGTLLIFDGSTTKSQEKKKEREKKEERAKQKTGTNTTPYNLRKREK